MNPFRNQSRRRIPPSDVGNEAPIALIVTDDRERQEHIAIHLMAKDFVISYADFDGDTLREIPQYAPHVILVSLSTHVDKAQDIRKVLKSHFADHMPPCIAIFTEDSNYLSVNTKYFNSVIFPPAHASQIATRVDSLLRLNMMEIEIIRRIETLRETFGIHHTLSDDIATRPYRILFIGKASPEFMVIINALQEKNVEVVAAFTTFTAFDYLHESEFDAVVMNALVDSEPAMTICETMRRNSKLYHVPSLFLVKDDTFDEHEKAFAKGARDIIYCNSETAEINGRILELANYHRIHSQLKQEFDDIGNNACLDDASKTYNSEFFSAHMRRVCKDVRTQGQFLGLITLKIWPNDAYNISSQSLDQANAKIGGMIKSMVRMQDITARISTDTFMIAIIDETHTNISIITKRLQGVIEAATFQDATKNGKAFTVKLTLNTSQLTASENSDRLITRSLVAIETETAA
ncbi:MAG: diguanylate cyclase domain-containing protein [Maricaulaceae bacterium]